METTTSAVNTGNLDPTYTILAEPSSEVSIIDTAFAPIDVEIAGLAVDSIVYSKVNYKWVVTARYRPDVPDTITGIYVSKVGQRDPSPPYYSASVTNTFFPSQHPCVLSMQVCCLNDFKDDYTIGSFASNITEAVGACDAGVQALPTQGMFDPALDERLVDGLFVDFPNSDVFRTNPGRVQLVIAETDLRNNFSKREDIPAVQGGTSTGYRLEFFVGMAYFTLLPTNAMSTTVSQTKIVVEVTDSLTFSFSSKQDYTFLKYMTLGLYQNRWLDGFVQKHMQFARITIVLPVGFRQNTQTGLIPLTSMRFAVSRDVPDQADQSQWSNPCYSETGSGLWDDPGFIKPDYDGAASQSCAMQYTPPLCTNPITETVNFNVLEFNFPIGDGFINETHAQPNSGYYLYVYFDVSAVDNYGRVTTTRLFAQSRLHELSLTRACDDVLEAELSLLEFTQVDVAIGLVGNQQDWDSSVYRADNVRQASMGGSLLDTTTLRNESMSLQSGLVTLVVRGEPIVFQDELTFDYYIEIEHLTTIHFLDPAKFEAVRDIMTQQGNAITVVRDTPSDTISIQLSQPVWDACSSAGGSLSCAVRHDIVQNQVRNPSLVHPFATGPATTDETATRDWITRNLLGVSDFSEALAANMTGIVRSLYGIDDRVNRAWYINPGHAWPRQSGAAQSALLLSDKLIVIAVIALRDGAGSIVRRRLLSTAGSPAMVEAPPPKRRAARVDAKGNRVQPRALAGGQEETGRNLVPATRSHEGDIVAAMHALEQTPRTEAIPPINFGVPMGQSVARALGIESTPSGTMRISLVGRFPADWDEGRVREAIKMRLHAHQKMYCPSCSGAYPVFYSLERHAAGQPGAEPHHAHRRAGRVRVRHVAPRPPGRGLLQAATGGALPALDDFRGTVDVVMTYVGGRNEILYTDVFRSLLRDTYPGGAPVDVSSALKTFAGGDIIVDSVDPAPWTSAAYGPGGGDMIIVRDSFDSKRIDTSGPVPSASWDNGGVDHTSPSAQSGAGAATNATNATLSAEEQALMDISRTMMMDSGGARRATPLDTIFLCVLFLGASMAIGVPSS